MKFTYINYTDRSADVTNGSHSKNSQNNQRADSLDFNLFQGAQPSENQNIRHFVGDVIAGISGATITLSGYFKKNTNKFYPGQKLYTGIGTARECTNYVQSYNESTLTLVLTVAPSITPNVGDRIGELTFGGVTSKVTTVNVVSLKNVEYEVTCVSFDKYFDAELVAGTYDNVDGRYIINDFVKNFINYNTTLDSLSYANNTLVQAAWGASVDGSAPTVDLVDFMELSSSLVFGWTHSASGHADLFNQGEYSPGFDFSQFTGVNSGTPTEGTLSFWIKALDFTKITKIRVFFGSGSAANFVYVDLPAPTKNDWQFISFNLLSLLYSSGGTMNWTDVTDFTIRIYETGSSSVKLNGVRVNASGSFTMNHVQPTVPFIGYGFNNVKPTDAMNTLANAVSYNWDIDYEADIHFEVPGTMNAPFNIGPTTNNYYDLQTEIDQSQIYNRIIVYGGQTATLSNMSQVFQGDNNTRSWNVYTTFANPVILINDGTGSHTAESGTNTTTIKWTAHGLTTGAWIINTTRSNTARQVTVVDANTLTIQAITSQTSGDTITWFNQTETAGIDGQDIEADFSYMVNPTGQSFRASQQTATLPPTTFIEISYVETVQIAIRYGDGASIAKLKAMGIRNGIFDQTPYTDQSIPNYGTALAVAQAQINSFKNPQISGSYTTDQDGLKIGMIQNINDPVRGFNENVLIQTISAVQKEGEYEDYFVYTVNFGTTLFGVLEFLEQVIKGEGSTTAQTTDNVDIFVTEDAVVGAVASNETASTTGINEVHSYDNVGSTSTLDHAFISLTAWQLEPSVGQPIATRLNLSTLS